MLCTPYSTVTCFSVPEKCVSISLRFKLCNIVKIHCKPSSSKGILLNVSVSEQQMLHNTISITWQSECFFRKVRARTSSKKQTDKQTEIKHFSTILEKAIFKNGLSINFILSDIS